MLFSKAFLVAVTTLVASTAAYRDYDYSYGLQARDFDDIDGYLDLYAREAEDDLIYELASRDVDDLKDLFRRALEVRTPGTIKRPNLGGNLRLSPGDIQRANSDRQGAQPPASLNAPPLPRNSGGSYFPPGATHNNPHGDAPRRGSASSMYSLFGTP